jgi:hypothetical protein
MFTIGGFLVKSGDSEPVKLGQLQLYLKGGDREKVFVDAKSMLRKNLNNQ